MIIIKYSTMATAENHINLHKSYLGIGVCTMPDQCLYDWQIVNKSVTLKRRFAMFQNSTVQSCVT